MPMHRRRAVGLSALALWGWLILGCSPRPLTAPAQPAFGEVRLLLGPSEGRTAQWAAPAAQARVRVDGPGMAAPFVTTVELSSAATASVTISGLASGPNRIVTLDRLDAEGGVIPGGTLKTTVDVPAASSAVAVIGRGTTPRGAVFERVLAGDRAGGTPLAETLDASGVQALVEAVIRQGATYPDLVDAAAIAADAIASRQVPAFETRYVLYPATLDVTLEGIPGPAPADVWLDDSLSPKNVTLYGGTHRVTPVVPGTWVLHAKSPVMGIEATRSITLLSNQSATVSINLGSPPDQIKAPMPSAGMASAFGVLNVGGLDMLVAAGGLRRATDSIYYHNQVLAYDGVGWAPRGYMPVLGAFGQAAALGGELYVAGAMRPGAFGPELQTDVHRFNGSRWEGVPSLPLSRGSAAIAALGERLWVIGGFRNASWGPFGAYPDGMPDPDHDYSAEYNATESFRYDPGAGTWTQLPTGLNVGRGDMASAVLNGRVYVFGGQEFTDFGGPYRQIPHSAVESADATGVWRMEPAMPTPRGGAAAVVAGGKVFVIGGCTIGGIPLGSVEVFDPATGKWAIKPPLRRARGYVSAGYLNGRIVVAGGGDGGSAGLEGVPQDTVESFVP